MATEETQATAHAYFEAWTSEKGADALRPLMSPEFRFQAGPHVIEGRETFLGAGGWPAGAHVVLLADAYQGEDGFQLYEASHGAARVKIAEHLTVQDGLLVASEIVVDGSAFASFLAGDPE